MQECDFRQNIERILDYNANIYHYSSIENSLNLFLDIHATHIFDNCMQAATRLEVEDAISRLDQKKIQGVFIALQKRGITEQ